MYMYVYSVLIDNDFMIVFLIYIVEMRIIKWLRYTRYVYALRLRYRTSFPIFASQGFHIHSAPLIGSETLG